MSCMIRIWFVIRSVAIAVNYRALCFLHKWIFPPTLAIPIHLPWIFSSLSRSCFTVTPTNLNVEVIVKLKSWILRGVFKHTEGLPYLQARHLWVWASTDAESVPQPPKHNWKAFPVHCGSSCLIWEVFREAAGSCWCEPDVSGRAELCAMKILLRPHDIKYN